MSDFLTLTDEDDGKLFRVRVLNTGDALLARYHCFTLAGQPLTFPCFADPDHPEDYRRWLHNGWARRPSAGSTPSRCCKAFQYPRSVPLEAIGPADLG